LFLKKEEISEHVSWIRGKKVTGMLLTSVKSAKDLNYLDPNINPLYANTIFNYIVDWKQNGIPRILTSSGAIPVPSTNKAQQQSKPTPKPTPPITFSQDRRLLDATKAGNLNEVLNLIDAGGANVNTKDEQVHI